MTSGALILDSQADHPSGAALRWVPPWETFSVAGEDIVGGFGYVGTPGEGKDQTVRMIPLKAAAR